MTNLSVPTRPVDVHALPVMLTALRLPSFHRHWPALAERADKEGWPAASFLAALAELEIAERETRRIRRHLLESRLPGEDAGHLRLQGDPRRSPRPYRGPRRRRLDRDRRQSHRHRQQWRGQDPPPLRHRPRPRRGGPARPLHANHRSRAEAPGRAPRPRPRGMRRIRKQSGGLFSRRLARQARPLRPHHSR
jgi:hypothetical protein